MAKKNISEVFQTVSDVPWSFTRVSGVGCFAIGEKSEVVLGTLAGFRDKGRVLYQAMKLVKDRDGQYFRAKARMLNKS